MKCRIRVKRGMYFAEYEDAVYGKGSNAPEKEWKKLENNSGHFWRDYFDTEDAAEDALKRFAESKSESKVVKEFEV